MSSTPAVVVDGLFRALCPSIDAILASSYRSATWSRHGTRRQQQLRPASRPLPLSNDRAARRNDGFRPLRPACQVRHTHESAANVECLNNTTQTPPETDASAPPSQTPTAKFYETLRELRGQKGKADVIRKHVQTIVGTPGEKANIFLYEALAAANWDTSGSVDELALLLRASQDSDLPPSSNFYHDALRVRSVPLHAFLDAPHLADVPLMGHSRSWPSTRIIPSGLQYWRTCQRITFL